jgi:tRNA(adenine34) deaminase
MGLALDEARTAADVGDVPVGAVVAKGDVVLATGRNRREADGDPTAHAEIVAIRDAARALGTWYLDGCELVVTLEPCVMCAGAAVLARLDRIVFGADDPKAGACGSLYEIPSDPRMNHRPEVVRGVLAEEAGGLLRAFFRDLRGNARD